MIDISENILKQYGIPEEYLTNHYPIDYFDFHIDIGARGIEFLFRDNCLICHGRAFVNG